MSTLFATIEVDGHLFGVDALKVQEVIRSQKLTPVPLGADELSGLLNLRGQIVAAIDLRRRLSLADDPSAARVTVVVNTGDGVVSFLADAVGDVIEVDDETFEPPPSTLDPTIRELVVGAHKLPECLLLVLDVDKAATVAA